MKYAILGILSLLLVACVNFEPTQEPVRNPTPEPTAVPAPTPTIDGEVLKIIESIQRGESPTVPPVPLSAAASGCLRFADLAADLEVGIVEYRSVEEITELKLEMFLALSDIQTAFGDNLRFSNAAFALSNAVGGPHRKANFNNGLLAGRYLARLCEAGRYESPSNPDTVIEFVCRGADLGHEAGNVSETYFNLVVHPCSPD